MIHGSSCRGVPKRGASASMPYKNETYDGDERVSTAVVVPDAVLYLRSDSGNPVAL